MEAQPKRLSDDVVDLHRVETRCKVCGPHVATDQHLGFPSCLVLELRFREQFPAAPWVGDSVLFDDRNASITTSHKSEQKAHPSLN